MKCILASAAVCLALSLAASATVNVTVTAPLDGAQLSSPFSLDAYAISPNAITGWVIYLDGKIVYRAGQRQSINASIPAPTGNHELVTRAWDSTGGYGSVYEHITITSGNNGLPVPPPWATIFSHIEDSNPWGSCHDPGCAGGSGSGTYWMGQHQSAPSRDGSSAEYFNSGVWANALWWHKFGAHNNVRNFLFDFYIYLDDSSKVSTQALEFEAFQFVGGYNYMIGTQCNYGSGVWDTWDEGSGHWYHTSIPCPKFSTNTWHHIQMYQTTNVNSHKYTYVTLVVDGKVYPVGITWNAKYLGWGDNLGAQWQLDVNGTGQGYHEWMDQATLTVW